MKSTQLIDQIVEWGINTHIVSAICLVGSYARGDARQNSDFDLIILSEDPQILITDQKWRNSFGEIEKSSIEDWGILKSVRTFYKDGTEIEFGITSLDWATVPLDPGTLKVVTDGMKILYDPNNILKKVVQAIG